MDVFWRHNCAHDHDNGTSGVNSIEYRGYVSCNTALRILTLHIVIYIYPVHGANLTLIQPMWSAYPYAPTSLYGIHMPLLPYMVIQPIVLGMALLWPAIDSALSQGPLLWRHNDMTVIVSRNTRGRERDTRQRLDNANARRLHTDRFFVEFNAICSTFLRNNPICIEGGNCRLSTVLGYSINARAVGPRTPYRVCGLAGDFTRAWVSHSLVNHWIYNFKASLLLC